MTLECVLAIDLGTGGPKVALVGTDGRTVAWSSRPVATRFLPAGGAEQDPHEMWAAVVDATRATVASASSLGPLPPIVAVAVTSQYMSIVPVAANGLPTGPCILWMDTRGAVLRDSERNEQAYAMFIERHGLIPLPRGNDNVAHVRVLRAFSPDAYEAAAAFVEPMDYVNARLTGRIGATQSTVFGLLACDNRVWGRQDYDPDLVAATRLDPDKLPPLLGMNDIVGPLTSGAAAELGIAAGVPVTTGTIDSITGAIGAGALTPNDGSVIIGTTSVFVSHIAEHRGALRAGILSVPSPLHGKYFVMAENGVGGRALEWALRLFGYGDDYSGALHDAAEIDVGADGVHFMPWLVGSLAPHPNDDVRAGFAGLSLRHDRRHLVRAALEGVALNLAWLHPAVESFVGQRFPFVRFGGGGAQSDLWAQVLADALDVPVHQLSEPRVTNARGAALLALSTLGLIAIDDVPGLLEVRSVFEPRQAHRAQMDEALGRLIELHRAMVALTKS